MFCVFLLGLAEQKHTNHAKILAGGFAASGTGICPTVYNPASLTTYNAPLFLSARININSVREKGRQQNAT